MPRIGKSVEFATITSALSFIPFTISQQDTDRQPLSASEVGGAFCPGHVQYSGRRRKKRRFCGHRLSSEPLLAERQLERASVQGTLFCDIGRTSAGNARQFAENMEFVLNVKLKYWTEHELERHYPKFVGLLPALEARNSIAKGEDENRREYLLQRSLMYSFTYIIPTAGNLNCTISAAT